MDGYLNCLSLKYDSVWVTKPSWCQPWTISLTGVLVIASSWLFVHSVVVTMIVLTLICAWWYIFLYAYPKVLLQKAPLLAYQRHCNRPQHCCGCKTKSKQVGRGDAAPN
ncbi:hypothetical protein AAC387_Pa10g0903 [Persea americana]